MLAAGAEIGENGPTRRLVSSSVAGPRLVKIVVVYLLIAPSLRNPQEPRQRPSRCVG